MADHEAVARAFGPVPPWVSFAVNDVASSPSDRALPRWAVAVAGDAAAGGVGGGTRGARGPGAAAAAAGKSKGVRPFPTASECELVCPDAHSEHGKGLLQRQAHGHGFISAVATAFDRHLPLSLRPQHLWALVLQGVARHVVANAEDLRNEFVGHEGKKELVVNRDEWAGGLGKEGLDWAGVVGEFSDQIAALTVPGVAELVEPNFSATTPTERVVSQVTVMDMLQEFFSYKVRTRCGFPRITLEGTPEDWARLADKTEALVSAKCKPGFAATWLPALRSVLGRIAAYAANPAEVDVTFWQCMCKRGGMQGSGGYNWINGWVNVFFPFLREGTANHHCVPYADDIGYATEPLKHNFYCHFGGGARPAPGAEGPDVSDFPSGFAAAPVTWDYLGTDIPLTFYAGFVGAAQDDDGDGTVRPELGWYIARNDIKSGDKLK